MNAPPVLSEVEIRVVGALIEKEITTPEYYPLSLNALKNACNQKSNRDPVVNYDENTCLDAINRMRNQALAYEVTGGGRVSRYEQGLTKFLSLTEQETAALTVMMLRGPQTPGEIRSRAGRLYPFSELAEVEATLDAMVERPDGALAVKLPRLPGQSQNRYMHLVGEASAEEILAQFDGQVSHSEAPSPSGVSATGSDRLDALEEEVTNLKQELEALKAQFIQFKSQFE